MTYDVEHLENDKHYKGKSWGWIPPTQQVYDAFHYVKEKVNPKSVFEIGFYKGHSTSYWAQTLPDARIISCGPPHPNFVKFAPKVFSKYDNVVDIFPTKSPLVWEEMHILRDSRRYRQGKKQKYINFDFVFVDGLHTHHSVVLDTTLACDILRARWVMFDNHEQEEVRAGIETYGKLKLEQVFPYEAEMWIKEEDGSETLQINKLELALYCKV